MGKGRRKLPPVKRKVGKGTENRKKMEKCINTKVAGIVLWVTWLRPHGPYMLHRDHPDMRTERAGRRGEDAVADSDKRQLMQIMTPLFWQEP